MSRRLLLAVGQRFGVGWLPTRYRTLRGWRRVIWTVAASAASGQVRVSTSDLLPMALAGPGFRSRRKEGEFASSVCGHAGMCRQGFRPFGDAGCEPASAGSRPEVAAAVVDVSARGAPHCRGNPKPECPAETCHRHRPRSVLGRVGRPSGRPVRQTNHCRCPRPSGLDDVSWAVCGAWRSANETFMVCFAACQGPPGIG